MSGDPHPDPVAAAIRGAGAAPEIALVQLWVHLQSHGAFQFALDEWKRDADAYASTRDDLLAELHDGRGGPVTSAVRAEHSLAAMQAVDAFLAETLTGRGSGCPQQPILVRACGREVWVVARRPRGVRPPAQKPTSVAHWMPHHWVIPRKLDGLDVTVTASGVSHTVLRDLEQLAGDAVVTVAAISFADGVEPAWFETSPGCGTCTCLRDERRRTASVVQALDHASANGAAVLVLPELTVSASVRREVAAWLQSTDGHSLRLVVAGSFHEADGDLRRNVAHTFDRLGNEVHRHVKLRPQTFSDGAGRPVRTESATGSTDVPILGTPLGLVVTPVCLDFCDSGVPDFAVIWQTVAVEWALVPSMSGASTMRAHERRAQDLARTNGTTTLVASQPEAAGDAHAALLVAGAGVDPVTEVSPVGDLRVLIRAVRSVPDSR